MPHRVIGQTVLVRTGGPVQFLHPARPFCLQASAQQVGEQAVVAPPAAHLIQRHQEQACPLCLSSIAWLPVRRRCCTKP